MDDKLIGGLGAASSIGMVPIVVSFTGKATEGRPQSITLLSPGVPRLDDHLFALGSKFRVVEVAFVEGPTSVAADMKPCYAMIVVDLLESPSRQDLLMDELAKLKERIDRIERSITD